MSTAYRIGGRGNRLTKKMLQMLATYSGWSIKKKPKSDDLILSTGMGYIHIYRNGKTSYNTFERFGGNSPKEFITALEDYGYIVYSEYEDEFFGRPKSKPTMMRNHKEWKKFITRLTTAVNKNGCKAGNDKSLATNILKKMGNIDIPNTLQYFEDEGGYCDCEILFNVDL